MKPPEAPPKNEQTEAVLRSVRVAIIAFGDDAAKLTLGEALAIEHAGRKLAALLADADARLYPSGTPRVAPAPVVESTAAEVADRDLSAHLADCSECCRTHDDYCETAADLFDAVRAFMVCAACHNVYKDHTDAERAACARRIDRR